MKTSKIKTFLEYNPVDKIYSIVPKNIIEKYQSIFPKFLLNLWENEGLSSHKDGFFWLVNPEEYNEIISQFLPNSGNLHVVIRTAFGGLIYLDESAKSSRKKNREAYNYLCPIYLQTTSMTSSLDAVMNGWLTTDEIYMPLMFYNIYAIGRKKIPRPESNECFGFSPAVALGGDIDPNNIKLFKIREHLLFLSQLK